MNVIHPRPNPIIAAMYTLRDMEVDVIVVHGPAGCGFMASRMLEEADVRVVTTGLHDNDLVFGASERLIETLRTVEKKFDPKTVAVIGTCSSMIIGEDMRASVKRSGLKCNTFTVDCHGCMENNISGAVKAISAGKDAGLISAEEATRQNKVMMAAGDMERKTGMAARDYLAPTRGPTKFTVAKRIAEHLRDGKKVAVVMMAKKELAYRFADILLAVEESRRSLGGDVFLAANIDPNVGLPRIRRYACDILSELESKGVKIDHICGGLDEYALVGEEMKKAVSDYGPDLLVLAGIPHAYPDYGINDILITDQPRQLSNYLEKGCGFAVGEISSHSMVMSTKKIIPTETGDTLREVAKEFI